MPECPHGSDPYCCAVAGCGPHGGSLRQPTPTYSWPARYDGDCAACPHPIRAGQSIVRHPTGGYAHEGD